VAKDLALDGHLPGRTNGEFRVIFAVVLTAAAITRREWFHKLLAPAIGVLFLGLHRGALCPIVAFTCVLNLILFQLQSAAWTRRATGSVPVPCGIVRFEVKAPRRFELAVIRSS
jgi:hypothetical protein